LTAFSQPPTPPSPFVMVYLYLSFCQHDSPFHILSVCPSVYLFICQSICLSVHLSVRSSVRPSVCISITLSNALYSVYHDLFISVSLPGYLFSISISNNLFSALFLPGSLFLCLYQMAYFLSAPPFLYLHVPQSPSVFQAFSTFVCLSVPLSPLKAVIDVNIHGVNIVVCQSISAAKT